MWLSKVCGFVRADISSANEVQQLSLLEAYALPDRMDSPPDLAVEARSSSRPPHRANAEKADFAFAFNAPSKPFWAATGRLRRHPKLRVTRTCGAEDEVQVPHAHPDTSPPEGCTPHHQQKQDSRIPAAGSSGEQGA